MTFGKSSSLQPHFLDIEEKENKLDGVLQGVSAVLKETGPGSQWTKLLTVLCHVPLSRPNEVDHITKKADR